MTKEGFHHYSRGKLLLTGEYFVLDGADALAVPTHPGQHFRAFSVKHKQSQVHWKSHGHDGSCWFEGKFYLDGKFYPAYLSDDVIGKRILEFLNAALEMSPGKMVGLATDITTTLEFDRSWGLGSSSTLVDSFATWLDIDAFELLKRTFGGSGYDVACAYATGPILYSNVPKPCARPVDLKWDFKDKILFAYLGNKQDSREGIRRYESNTADRSILEKISSLTKKIIKAADISEFSQLIDEHESMVSAQTGLEKVKDLYFNDFDGTVKSLGAWGGDFIMIASGQSTQNIRSYFYGKGLNNIFNWRELILERGSA